MVKQDLLYSVTSKRMHLILSFINSASSLFLFSNSLIILFVWVQWKMSTGGFLLQVQLRRQIVSEAVKLVAHKSDI